VRACRLLTTRPPALRSSRPGRRTSHAHMHLFLADELCTPTRRHPHRHLSRTTHTDSRMRPTSLFRSTRLLPRYEGVPTTLTKISISLVAMMCSFAPSPVRGSCGDARTRAPCRPGSGVLSEPLPTSLACTEHARSLLVGPSIPTLWSAAWHPAVPFTLRLTSLNTMASSPPLPVRRPPPRAHPMVRFLRGDGGMLGF
jgi:hypothetical protein